MRNLVLIHLESLNYINYQTNKELFRTLHHWEKKSLSFSKYYATATSTLMVLSDMAFGGIMQNEPSRRLTDRLEKYYYKKSFLDDFKEQGYQIGVCSYPKGSDLEGVNEKNFIGYTVKMQETDSYEKYMKVIDETMAIDKPFIVWACNYISNVSYNCNVSGSDQRTGLERWENGYMHMDKCVYEILSMIEKKGLLNNTTIIFYGDHGDDLYIHGTHKGLAHAIEPYETLIHTPFWIYDNRFRKSGQVTKLINTTDVRGIIEQILSLPDKQLEINDLELPTRNFSLSRNVYAAQMLKAGSFNKGYALTDGKFLMMVSNAGMQLFQIEIDPTCHHNLLDYFFLEENELRLNQQLYSSLRYHFTAVLDESALFQIRQIFSAFRERLQAEVFRLYEYAECVECFPEIEFSKIQYGQTENQVYAHQSQKQTNVIAEVINRLLNCMETDCLAAYTKVGSELKGIYSTIKIRDILRLEESLQYKVLYIGCKDDDEFFDILPWVKQNKDKMIMVVYVKKSTEKQKQFLEQLEISCQYSDLQMQEGRVFLFGKFFEGMNHMIVPENFKVLAIMHFYNEADILEKTIKYLLSQKVDIYLVDNWSEDGSYEIAEKYQKQYPGHIFLEHFPCDGKNDYYDWYHQLERTEQIAMELEYDWYIHHDADEMRISPWKNRNLREAIYYIDMLGFNVIDNTVIDFKLTRDNKDNIFMSDTYFDFRHYRDGFRQRKTWKKGKSIDLKNTGGHIARVEEPKVFPLKILNRHYPFRDIEQAKKKVFLERKPRFTIEKKEFGWHGHYDNIVQDEDFFPDEAGLILWDDSIWNHYYVSLFMGCGIWMRKEEGTFDICTKYFSGKKIVLYGAGKYGVYCCEKLMNDAEIVAWIDRDFAYMPWICCKSIDSLDRIKELEFDMVLIAIQSNEIWREVKNMLVDMGVPPKKIY